jgi:DNA-binding transcriptional ArsR family regulator
MKPQTQSTQALSSEDTIVQLADMFRLMGDPTRLRIILVCLDAPISVGDIATRLSLSASLVSHHLRLLKAARVLRAERRGKQIFYSALDAHISCVVDDMVAHIGEPIDVEELI